MSQSLRHVRERSSTNRLSEALLLTTAITIALSAGPTWAQDSMVEELVVTARKREESLIDVPVAVTAMGREEVQRYAASDLTSLSQQVPSLEISTGSAGSGGSFAIRGLGSSAADAGIEQSVAVNIDGAPITRGYISRAAFFDLQQVEVLKGPQALFFGKNSPGGVISLSSASPGGTLEGYATAGYEFNADERYIEGAVGGPINDAFGARLALRASEMRGWVENVAGPQADPFRNGAVSPGARDQWGPGTSTIAGRLTLSWRPDDTLSAVLKIQGTRYEDHSAGTGEVVSCAPGRTRPTANILFVPGVFEDSFGDCKADWRTSIGAYPAELAPFFLGARDGRPYTEVGTWLGSGPIKGIHVTGLI